MANYGGGSFTAFRLNDDFSIGSVMLNDVYGRGSGADPEGRQVQFQIENRGYGVGEKEEGKLIW